MYAKQWQGTATHKLLGMLLSAQVTKFHQAEMWTENMLFFLVAGTTMTSSCMRLIILSWPHSLETESLTELELLT